MQVGDMVIYKGEDVTIVKMGYWLPYARVVDSKGNEHDVLLIQLKEKP